MNTLPLVCIDCLQAFSEVKDELHCQCSEVRYRARGGYFAPVAEFEASAEVGARDAQSASYLAHSKHPVHIANFERWLEQIPKDDRATAVDLGCGPGPFSERLANGRLRCIGVDFSSSSLKINASRCQHLSTVFIQEDVRRMQWQPGSIDILVISDLLQHVTGYDAKRKLLEKAMGALKPGGRFYLSFFNLNLKNRLVKDKSGTFSEGKIPYERMSTEVVQEIMPDFIRIEQRFVMNIVNLPVLDRILTKLPFAKHLGRWIVLAGHRAA